MSYLIKYSPDNTALFSLLAQEEWVVPVHLTTDTPLNQRGIYMPHSDSYVIPHIEESFFKGLSVFTKYAVCPYTILGGSRDFIYLGKNIYLGGYGALTERSAFNWIEKELNCTIIPVFLDSHQCLSDIATLIQSDKLAFLSNTLDLDTQAKCATLKSLINITDYNGSMDFLTTPTKFIVPKKISSPIHQTIASRLDLDLIELESDSVKPNILEFNFVKLPQ